MAQRSVSSPSFTAGPFADTTALTSGQYLALQGVTSIQTAGYRLVVQEIYLGGQAPTVSSPMYMVFARSSTVGATLSLAGSAKDAVTAGEAATGTAQGYNTATTAPQRSATLGLLNMSFNAFGGISKWQSPQIPGKVITVIGIGAVVGDATLSNFTGGTSALVGGHIIYEQS